MRFQKYKEFRLWKCLQALQKKDRQTLESVEQKSSNPYRQLTLKDSEWLIFAEKNGKKYEKELRGTKFVVLLQCQK